MPNNSVIAYEQLYVYVDGAYSTAYPDRYSGAFAIVDPVKDCLLSTHSGCGIKAVSMKNVAGELSAVMRAVQYASKLANNLVIFYDYEGIEKWVTGKWQAKKTETQAYREYMNKYKDKLQFVKVRAHTGNKYNELVDKAAKEAIKLERWW